MIKLKLFLLNILLLSLSYTASAQHAQHIVSSHIELGSATATRPFNYGVAVEYNTILSERIELGGGLRISNEYPSTMGAIKAQATIYPSLKNKRWSINNVIQFTNYSPYPLNQFYYRLTGTWHNNWFRVDFGNAFTLMSGSGVSKFNPVRVMVGVQGMVRKEDKPWNIGAFIRNFDRFHAYGTELVQWGAISRASISENWSIWGEFYISTVGNFSGTANYNGFTALIGGAYRW